MNERYPIGETASIAVAVLRHEGNEPGYRQWSVALTTAGGEATVHVPGHYPGVLATRLRQADERFAPGAKLPAGRDEFLDLTAIVRGEEETLALSSTPRSPVRVTVEVPRDELPASYAAGEVFAMPCRTRWGGLEVEGFGIVYLEAAATNRSSSRR